MKMVSAPFPTNDDMPWLSRPLDGFLWRNPAHRIVYERMHRDALEWTAKRLKREHGVAATRDEVAAELFTRFGFAKRQTRLLHADLDPDLKRAPGENARRVAKTRKRTTERSCPHDTATVGRVSTGRGSCEL
jgi:hypothetical protein